MARRGDSWIPTFRRKDEGGAADIQWQIAAVVLSMRPGLQFLANSGMTHVHSIGVQGDLSLWTLGETLSDQVVRNHDLTSRAMR